MNTVCKEHEGREPKVGTLWGGQERWVWTLCSDEMAKHYIFSACWDGDLSSRIAVVKYVSF